MSTKAPDHKEALQNWGRQTIAYVIKVRAELIDQPLVSAAAVIQARNDMETIVEAFWSESLSECGPDPTLPKLTTKFVTKILNWAAKHRDN